jgi:nitroreductase
MDTTSIKGKFLMTLLVLCIFTWAQAQESKTIKLTQPTKKGGLTIMEAFSKRASERSWADRELSSQDLSNLLWAANGINRPDSKKRTAPSPGNSQDVDIYVFIKSGVYLYDAAGHALNLVSAGDHRSELISMPRGGPKPSAGASGTPGNAPVGVPGGSSAAPGGSTSAPPGGGTRAPGGMPARDAGGAAAGNSTAAANFLMVSDISKFGMGTDESKKETAIIDTAMVSENISLFCAGNGLANVPRTGSLSNKDALKTLLKLKDIQYIVIENAVGYPVESK